MNFLKYGIWIAILLLFILPSCNNDDDVAPCTDPTDSNCPNYDPCFGLGEVSADFFIYEAIDTGQGEFTSPEAYDIRKIYWPIEYYDTDQVLTFGAYFEAKIEDADRYEWHIGSEIITSRSFYRQDFPLGASIPVTLIVEKKPNLNCFPYDDGRDTLTRVFKKAESYSGAKIWGTYFVKDLDDPGYEKKVSLFFEDLDLEQTNFVTGISPYTDTLFFKTNSLGFGEIANKFFWMAFEQWDPQLGNLGFMLIYRLLIRIQ